MLMRMRTGTHICSQQKCKIVKPIWKIVRQLCEKLDIKPTQISNSTLRCLLKRHENMSTKDLHKNVHSGVCMLSRFSPISLWPWTVAHQGLPSMGFSSQEYWSGLPCPSPGDLANQGIKPRSPTLQAHSLPFELSQKPNQE